MSWIVSPQFDALYLIGPLLFSGLSAFFLPDLPVSPLLFLLLVVCIDVGHTWASLYRTLLSPEGNGLLWKALGLALLGSGLVWAVAPQQLWRVLAYIAVYHFIRQQGGFAALYRPESIPRWVDRLAVEGPALCAILYWHAALPRPFAWFQEGDFIDGLPGWLMLLCPLLSGVCLIPFFATRPRRGRLFWALASAINWWGAVLSAGDLPFTVANVVGHGVPYYALVWKTGSQQWDRGKGPIARWWYTIPMFFVLLPILLGVAEELLWEALVWQEFFEWSWSPIAALAPLLVVPQLTHYILDGWIWQGPYKPR
jgi:hypothetical protein